MPLTYTASDQNATPRAIHAGVNFVRAVYNANGVSLSLSDVVQMIRIPNGAMLIDAAVSGILGTAASTVKLGLGSAANPMTDIVTTGGTTSTTLSSTGVLSTATLSATAIRTVANSGNLPVRISLSDDANPQWVWLYLTVITGTTTVTCSIQVTAQYVMGI